MRRAIGIILLLCCAVAASKENTNNQQGYRINDIKVVIHPIFSEEERTGWIYETADELHIDTKPYVIERSLPFKQGETVHKRLLKEAGRILRRQGFLRDAKVSWAEAEDGQGINVTVETWETWTLVPTVDVSREGGVTEYAYAVSYTHLTLPTIE